MILRKGTIKKAYCGLVYGMPGSGKTTLLARRKENFFIGTEPNAEFDIVGYQEAHTFEDILNQIKKAPDQIRANHHRNSFDTVVIDHITQIEKLCKESFCGTSQNLATWGNGHGAGYQELEKRFIYFLNEIKINFQDRGINVVFIGHADEKTHTDIISGIESVTYRPQLDKRVNNLISAYCDFIFLLHNKVETKENGLKKPSRYLYTTHYETIFAKKRGGIELPDELEMKNSTSWDDIHPLISKVFNKEIVSEEIEKNSKEWYTKEYTRLRKDAISLGANEGELPKAESLSFDRLVKATTYMSDIVVKLKKEGK